MKINLLTDSKIQNFKLKKTPDGTLKKKVFRDGDGFSLAVTPTENKIWKSDISCLKVRDFMTLEPYPALSF